MVFSMKGPDPTPLYFRVIKVDPNTFEQGLRRLLAEPTADNRTETLLGLTRRFLIQLCGVDMTPPKSFFYSHGEGSLLIYATLTDLDTIERAVEVLNISPHQVNIKTVFVELPKADARAFWEKFGYTNQPASPGRVRTTTLTAAEAEGQLRRWKSPGGTNILGSIAVTTLDGRKSQAMIVDLRKIMTRDANGRPKPETVSLGPTLDITPHLTEDQLRVEMDLGAKVVDLVGYNGTPLSSPIPSASGANSASATPPLAVPRVRVARPTAPVPVEDGHTVVLGNFAIEDVGALEERVPVLGDIPVIGRLFRSEFEQANGSDILVFVTPTIIDPAGNPIRAPGSR